MKVRLPIIGQVQTGKDIVEVKEVKSKTKNINDLGAGFLDLSNKDLVGYKTVSDRLIKSYTGWVYANVKAIAEEVSKLEFELYQTGMSNGEMTLKPIEQHPLLDLLDRFNDFTTTSDAMFITQSHIELAGDTFFYLEGAPSNITNIYILQPDKMELKFDGNGISGYEYTDIIDGKKKVVEYSLDEIIHIKAPNPGNSFRGKSTVEAAATEVDTDNLAGEFLKMFFQNGAMPNVAFTTDTRLTRDDIERLTKDLRRNYSGARNAFKSLLLGSGLKPVTVQQSGKEMELLGIEEAMRDKIMAIFGNTKASLGIVEDVNRANAEATLLGWKQSTIKPKMQRIVDTLNEYLVPRYGDNLVLTFCDPVPEDRSDDLDEAVQLKQAGIINRNEARALVDYEPVDGGDNFNDPIPFDPNAQQDQTPKSIRNIHNVNYKRHFRRSGQYERFAKYKAMYPIAKQIAEKSLIKKETPKLPEIRRSRHFTNDQLAEYEAKLIGIVDAHEQKFANAIDQFLLQLEDKAIKNLHNIAPKGLTKRVVEKASLFDVDTEVDAGIDLFTPLVDEIAKMGALEAYALLNVRQGYIPSKDLNKSILERVKLFTKGFVETDQKKLADILEAGLKEGNSIAQISNSIRTEFGDFRKNQATRIARTEALNASNAGAVDAYKASGVVSGKQWLTDGNPCELCAPLEGTIVSLDDNFFDQGDIWQGNANSPITLDFSDVGEPPLHPNCECTVIPVLFDEKNVKPEISKEYVEELEKRLGITNE